MNNKEAINLVPKECISSLVAGLVAVLFFVCVAIIPNYLTGRSLNRQIGDLRYQLEEHKNILPLYASLKKLASEEKPDILILPQKTGLDMSRLDIAIKTLRDISKKSSMSVISISPDEGEAYKGVKSVVVAMSLKGDFANLRTLLTDLGALPYVEDVEGVSMRRESYGRMLAITIKIKLAVL
jgi:hypothetical protein